MSNSKPLTSEELLSFKNRFNFEILTNENGEEFICWERKSSGKGCYMRLKKANKIVISDRNRKYTISSKAIKLWLEKYKGEYDLFDIQQAIITQEILFKQEDFVDSYLKNPNVKIKTI